MNASLIETPQGATISSADVLKRIEECAAILKALNIRFAPLAWAVEKSPDDPAAVEALRDLNERIASQEQRARSLGVALIEATRIEQLQKAISAERYFETASSAVSAHIGLMKRASDKIEVALSAYDAGWTELHTHHRKARAVVLPGVSEADVWQGWPSELVLSRMVAGELARLGSRPNGVGEPSAQSLPGAPALNVLDRGKPSELPSLAKQIADTADGVKAAIKRHAAKLAEAVSEIG